MRILCYPYLQKAFHQFRLPYLFNGLHTQKCVHSKGETLMAKADNITFGQLIDTWAEEELKIGTLSNGTVVTYLQVINRMKQHPVSR